MELRFAVVEDRLPDAQRLESLLRLAFGGGHTLVCDHYESGDAFLQAFPSKNHQVVFLDICMEGTNGIETARILRRTDPDLLLVFVTSSPEYVWDAFPVHPFDYLLKPYREEKLFQLADELLRAQENFIVCNRGVILNMDKVLRLDSDCFEMLDGTRLPVRQKDKNTLFAQFTQYQFRHMRREL